MYAIAAAEFCTFVALYYLGEYLFAGVEPELDSKLDGTDGHNVSIR
jgi:hypothetical protein